MPEKHEYYMAQALMEAKAALEFGEVPIGAVIVCQDEIVARAHNWRETWKDPTAHAELIAIQSASRKLGGWRLSDCDLYVTLEPCLMCAGSILLSRLANVYFGAHDPKGGAITSRMQVLVEGVWNHQPEIRGGILEDECGKILKEFFRRLRRKETTRRDV